MKYTCTIGFVFQHIEFLVEDEARSFVALLDGYYRLSYDYHYCLSNQVFSPTVKTWNTLKCYGPLRFVFMCAQMHVLPSLTRVHMSIVSLAVTLPPPLSNGHRLSHMFYN